MINSFFFPLTKLPAKCRIKLRVRESDNARAQSNTIQGVGSWELMGPGGGYLGQFLLGTCCWPLETPTPL